MRRRKFFEGLLAGGTVLVTAGVSEASDFSKPFSPPLPKKGSADPTPPSEASTCEGEAPWQLLAPLERGDDIGLGWRLVDLSPVDCGAAVLTLRSNETDREMRVHLCRHHGSPKGVAHSDAIDLILMNRGDGASFTEEPLGRVLNVLAAIIARNEQRGAVLPESMISHDARLSFYRKKAALL